MHMDPTHFAAPLVCELPPRNKGDEPRLIEFARVTMDVWARWQSRVAAANRAAVRAKMLKDREKFGDEAVPMAAVVKTSNDELTKRLTLGEIAAAVTQQPRFIARLLREQAKAAGSDPALVDEIGAFDQFELAGLLTNEAVLELPLLLPLSRHRARAAERAERFQAITTKRRETLAAIVSKMPSVPPSFGTPSASATAA